MAASKHLEQAEEHLRHVDGVMLGRAAYQNPVLLAEVDARFFGGAPVDMDAAVEPMPIMSRASSRPARGCIR